MTQKLAACLLNISEAKNFHIVENVAKAAVAKTTSEGELKCNSVLLNIFSDKIYNRSVISIAGNDINRCPNQGLED